MTDCIHTPVPFGRHYALFLDVDGTLADFCPDPADVLLPPDVQQLLLTLRQQLQGAVALVSGRNQEDLARLLEHQPLCCLGLHGLTQNACCPGGEILALPSAEMVQLRALSRNFCDRHPGVTVEDKGPGLALHYRRSPQWHPAVRQFAEDYLAAAQGCSDFVVLQGKMVVEFKPAGADKGAGVNRLMQHPPFQGRVPVFIGDDVTDEAAFTAVNRMHGVSVKCGEGTSAAQWRLADVAAVRRWLREYSHYLSVAERGRVAIGMEALRDET